MRKLLAGLMIAVAAMPASAQTVRAGIEAWQKGDMAGAVAIWKPLAEKGDADAAFNLGQAYRLGRGVPLDLAQAQSWFDRAARKGHVDAQTTLGLLLFQNGNRVAAMRWLNSAAEAGEPRALLMVGTALYNGDGIPADHVKAYAYVSRAAAQGLAAAKATLADMDEVMPIEQRQKGVALAQSMATEKKPAAPTAVAPKTAVAKPAPKS
ncbi:MAG: tetratricopeptide repeat protein, partial [Sphingomicrobium sp.]